jgi:hypothetical protein
MALPLFTKANNFCTRIVEIENEFLDFHARGPNDGVPKIRSYTFYANPLSGNQIQQRQQHFIDKVIYSTSPRSSTSYLNFKLRYGGFESRLLIDEIDVRCFSENFSKENEFQLSLVYDEYELFQKYVQAILYERLSPIGKTKVVYTRHSDTIIYTAALKALRDCKNGKDGVRKKL